MTTMADLQKMHPDAAVESTCSGEVVIYTGLRIDSRNEAGPLAPFECPSCDAEDQDDDPGGCTDTWHVDNWVKWLVHENAQTDREV